jgi:hypothetical protein
MKMFIFGVIAVMVLGGGWLFEQTLSEVVQREHAAEALAVPEGDADGGTASLGSTAEDDDAGQEDAAQDAAAAPRWQVSFNDGSGATWEDVSTVQQDGKDGHLFKRAGSEMLLIVTVMGPDTDDPATELIEKLWDTVGEQQGMATDAIDMVSYGAHTWVGFQFHGALDGMQKTGMTYASIDTTSRGAKLLVVGMWPDAENDVASAAFHQVLEHVEVQRL